MTTPKPASAPPADALQDRVSEIEDAIAAGTMSAAQVFTQMRQLVAAKPPSDDELPGMWEHADFMGGATDSWPAAEPAPVAQRDDLDALLDDRADDHGGDRLLTDAAQRIRDLQAAIADHARRESELEAIARKNRDGFEEYERRYYLEVTAREALEASLAAYRADAERYRVARGFLSVSVIEGRAANVSERHGDYLARVDAAVDALRQEATP